MNMQVFNVLYSIANSVFPSFIFKLSGADIGKDYWFLRIYLIATILSKLFSG